MQPTTASANTIRYKSTLATLSDDGISVIGAKHMVHTFNVIFVLQQED
jgi:hypothetical protein